LPRKTDGQKVDELTERVARLEAVFEVRSAQAAGEYQHVLAEFADLRSEVRRVLDRQAATDAKQTATDHRCAALEKQGDRNWQAWLALVGAGLALLVALLKK
jgi:ElaB/YqjD/DUF883 family membrane-anchored ribosome-binding protein